MLGRLLTVALAAALAAALAGCGGAAASAGAPSSAPPPTERPLLGAPDPAGPTQRGVFLKDPKGQVQTIAAGGHLVAWSVRTPAARRHDDDYGQPAVVPKSSKLVIADERDGSVLTVGLGRRWVSQLQMIRGPGGPAEPQLAVSACRTRKRSSCADELLTLTAEPPLKVVRRTRGPDATAALAGELDSGRRLSSRGRSCAAQLSVREADGTVRALPPLPARDKQYKRCDGLDDLVIYGRFAFASVLRTDARYGFTAEFFYGLDLAAGPSAGWTEVARPYRYTDGGGTYGIGPALTDGALYWETFDTVEETVYSLDRVVLPGDIAQEPTAATPNTSDPIAPDTGANVCDIAATDSAIYELANPYCAVAYGSGRRGKISRVVNPAFRAHEEG